MRSRNLFLALASFAFLTVCGMGQATSQKNADPASKAKQVATTKTKAPLTNVSRGTITAMDAKKLVLAQRNKKTGKTEETTFVIGADTSKLGYPTVGNEAIVHYRSERNELIATSVLGVQKTTKAKASKG